MHRLNQHITAEQLRSRLGGISNTTLWRMVKSGKLPAPVSTGRKRLFDEGRVAAVLSGKSGGAA
jgi:excisionase family DNA binding protein